MIMYMLDAHNLGTNQLQGFEAYCRLRSCTRSTLRDHARRRTPSGGRFGCSNNNALRNAAYAPRHPAEGLVALVAGLFKPVEQAQSVANAPMS
jgi:hypothetical protein